MIKLEQILEYWKTDSIIDDSKPHQELISTPLLHAKYVEILSQHRLATQKAKFDHAKMKKIRREYYLGNLDKETLDEYGWEPCQFVLSDPKIARKIETDRELINMLLKKVAHEEIVTYCETVLKSLHNRTWDLGNFIKYRQLTSGR